MSFVGPLPCFWGVGGRGSRSVRIADNLRHSVLGRVLRKTDGSFNARERWSDELVRAARRLLGRARRARFAYRIRRPSSKLIRVWAVSRIARSVGPAFRSVVVGVD